MTVLYTLPTCGKCKILKQKMEAKGIEFEEINDVKILEEEGIDVVPVLDIGNDWKLNFVEANKWVNEQ